MPEFGKIRGRHPADVLHVGALAQVHALQADIDCLFQRIGLRYQRVYLGIDLVRHQLDFVPQIALRRRQFAMHDDG